MGFFTKNKIDKCSIVVVAAGSSTRMGEDKILMDLYGKPLIVRTLEAFNKIDCVEEIVVVTMSEKIPLMLELCKIFDLKKVKNFVSGGDTRTKSALNGVRAVSDKAKFIGIHDGARPFIDETIVENAIEKAKEIGAAVPAIKSKDTVRQARNGIITKSLDRESLFFMQTPQMFEATLIKSALEKAVDLNLSPTDDAEAVIMLGHEVAIVEGSEQNIKLTTKTDIRIAEAILEDRGWY